jgi:3-hydroxyacyl-CoA dehydrogenase
MEKVNEVVELEKQGNIAVIHIDNPPVNALGVLVRKGLVDGVAQSAADDSIQAVILNCKGRTFIAGADIKEFGKTIKEPDFMQVMSDLETCCKPLIAAMHGTVLGGGLETALACHYRIAVAGTQFGSPEVKLGIIPGAGGTQRLPRIVGVEKALQMITGGNPIGSSEAREISLIDKIVEGDLLSAALAFAGRIIEENKPLRVTGQLTDKIEEAKNNPQVFDDFRKSIARKTRGFIAPEAGIQAVEAAVQKPFADGLEFENSLFEKLMSGSQSAAQRHYFFAERQAAKIPDIPKDTPQMDIKGVGIIGAGTMGGGITMNFVNIGVPVTLVEVNPEGLDRGLAAIRKNYEVSASKGKITAAEIEQRMSLVTGSTNIEAVSDADLVIEAVFENMDLKKEIFTKLNDICKPDAIMASNTSYLNIDEIAAMTDRPENVLGFHFFSPANVMKLLEIVRGEKTSKNVLATCLAVAKRIRKIAVMVGVCHGFAGNRMYSQRRREVDALLLEGASITQLDRALYEFGFPMGPFVLSDLIGNDIGWNKETTSGSSMQEILCEMGRLGLKTGSGFYKYEASGRTPILDPEVDKLVDGLAAKNNITQRAVADDEIVKRCIYAIINEGAKILEEGIAVRPSDLDVIWVNGYGWPVYLGGPMFYADLIGVDKILAAIQEFERKFGDSWKPAPLLEKLVSGGKGFRDLN